MKKNVQELILTSTVCLLLYYLYWSIGDEDFIVSNFTNHTFLLTKIGTDAIVCLTLTFLSTLYGRGMIYLTNCHETLQKMTIVPTLVLFVLDMFTAWGMSELSQLLFSEQNLLVYFQDFFVFGILATLVSSIKINSTFWQKKMEMEHERIILENKISQAERVMAQTRLHNLQAQVDPHFFFNNLSVLSSLISTDTKSAKEFVSALAMLYRHILNGMKKELVPLTEELQLVNEYAKLLSIRHGKVIQINLPPPKRVPPHTFVPPTSIQHLIENAVKHNAMTIERPLIVSIHLNKDNVHVHNSKNPLSGTQRHPGTGLAILEEQLKLFGAHGFEKREDRHSFSIIFPLIQQKRFS